MTTTARDSAAGTPSRGRTWVVTAPHGVRDGADSGWRPFGRRHAIQPGSRWAACGRDAGTWRTFPDLAFDGGQAQACVSCLPRVEVRA